MKNSFDVVLIIVFQLGVICKSYRQVLTPINNSQLLLKLPILDKFRLATLQKSATQINYSIKTGRNQFRRNESSHDLDSSRAISKDEHCLSVRCFYNNAKLWHFCRLSETMSLLHSNKISTKGMIKTSYLGNKERPNYLRTPWIFWFFVLFLWLLLCYYRSTPTVP